ncbi:MAG: 30S ribosomal protein S16 [Bacteroidales bacterium]|jgi:small subunit ribosomal protein S16|nr:30S ribosomal protein S16 [Bacteroidales bacterium]
MPVKIRLTRRGRKKLPYYHIVIADSRAPRDGRFIESIGTFDPTTNPSIIKLDFDKAIDWLMKGAQPTDTCRTILSKKGVMLKKHLLVGVKKKALTEEQAEEKFQAWITEKESKNQSDKDNLLKKSEEDKAKRLEAEKKISDTRAEGFAKKLAEEAAANVAKEAEKAEAKKEKVEESTKEAKAEDTKTEKEDNSDKKEA